ncbi:DUF3696 domain-containing protein [Rhizobium sp. K102]|uniref:AAA family ATPase n=1 Tax=Rhizobium sp. K102 TaxID=2918527 RepID=UPI001EFA79CC|nr:DUF3696 domain-containing protein [Rhizobium sp. K102]ULR44045.1 DUF3696 domain-containing protein [Rhizobium sp. K102]
MIKRWYIKNFKSFRDAAPLEMSRINVLAGANSSGKSSIIQSILLLKQTVQYGARSRPIAFNGPLLRLGDFRDVRNRDAVGEPLILGFDLDFSGFSGDRSAPWRRRSGGTFLHQNQTWDSLSLQLTYSHRDELFEADYNVPDPRLSKQSTDLSKVSLSVSMHTESESSDVFMLMEKLGGETGEAEPQRPQLELYNVSLDEDSKLEVSTDKPDAQIRGTLLWHFLPAWTAVSYNRAAKKIIDTIEFIFTERSMLTMISPDVGEERVSPNVIAVVNDWLLERGAEIVTEGGGPITAKRLKNHLKPHLGERNLLNWQRSDEFAGDTGRFRQRLLSVMLKETPPSYDIEFEQPRTIRNATEYLREFLTQGVRYLGPLRDAPRPVYPVEALENPTDVGYRGEHTAAVLDLNGSNIIAYRSPPEPSKQDYAATSTLRHNTLISAVKEWLSYLGVAEDVQTTDAGVFGNQLQVSTDTSGRMDHLTNVGVGVSQVLPLVVTALLAQPGNLLIFEQPELHLHPRVQARLADFFLALALDGKQILLETHSEYLVDRFRLRIAQSDSDTIRPLVNMMFSEKKAGTSTLTPIQISEFGAITNWPKDFFEQSQQDVGQILKAAASKRKHRTTESSH